MEIRQYQPGDEVAQARIYNTAAGPLPSFKPASPDEILRRHQGVPTLATSTFYATEDNEIIGYAVFDRNGRVSFPWCLPGYESARSPLMETVLQAMTRLGLDRAWAAYRADWTEILDALHRQGFVPALEMINYVTELGAIPRVLVPEDTAIVPTSRCESEPLYAWLKVENRPEGRAYLDHFFWDNPYLAPESLFQVQRTTDGQVLGMALVVARQGYADPTKLDAAMPCFRLGAFGTERERHKRVNGMFSCLAASHEIRQLLLSEAADRLEGAGLTHIATQAAADQPELVAFYDRHIQRQGAFPIVSRALA